MTGLGSSCGACKFLRRKCSNECVFAPYFCYDQAANHFGAVHKVFGASNVSKLLLHLPIHTRSDAASTISYEALARIHDPVYGCVASIVALQEQVANLQEEIEFLGTQMMNLGIENNWGGSAFNHNVRFQTANPVEAMNLQFYQNLQQADLPKIYEDDQPSYFCDSESNLMERLFEGMDDEILTPYPWLSNDSDTGK